MIIEERYQEFWNEFSERCDVELSQEVKTIFEKIFISNPILRISIDELITEV